VARQYYYPIQNIMSILHVNENVCGGSFRKYAHNNNYYAYNNNNHKYDDKKYVVLICINHEILNYF